MLKTEKMPEDKPPTLAVAKKSKATTEKLTTARPKVETPAAKSPEEARIWRAKLADLACAIKFESDRFENPELKQHWNKHVAVFGGKIVASGDDLAEVRDRAAAECDVPTSRIIMSYWGHVGSMTSEEEEDV